IEAEGLALVVEPETASEVIQSELDVVQLGPEVRLVRPAHGLAAAGLVVDHLDHAIADVVDAVDLPDDLRAVELQVEPALERDGSEPAHALHPGRETNVVAQDVAYLLLLPPAVEHTVCARQVTLEV